MRCPAIASRNASGTKRGWSTSSPPAATSAFMMKFWPKQWNIGTAQRPRSSGVIRRWRTVACAFETTLAWLSITPLGRPVVAEV